MNIILLQKNFKQGVFATSYITGKNNNLPILNNLLIQAKDGIIKFISTDLDVGIVSTIRGKIEEEGSLTINAKILANYINLLPNKKIDITTDKNNLVIECDNYKTKINGEAADDYPLIPEVDKTEFFTVDIEKFKEAVANVIFAVASDENRPALSGVLLTIEEDKMVLVGTDSYRLSEKTITLASNQAVEARRVIVPLKTLTELNRIITGDYGDSIESKELKIILNENQIVFIFNNIEIVSRLINEKYPDYKQIIPESFKTEAVIDHEEFVRAIKTSAIFSKSGINDIRLDFKQASGQLVISSASGMAGENEVVLNCDITGEENTVSINFKYLLDGLNNFKGKKVKWQMIAGNIPCILSSVENDGCIYVVMPIKQ